MGATNIERVKELKRVTKPLQTITNYAKKNKTTRQTVYNMIEDKRLDSILIDGVNFIIL